MNILALEASHAENALRAWLPGAGGTNGDSSGFGSSLIPKSSTEAFDIAVMEGLDDLEIDDELDDPNAATDDAYNPTSYQV